MAWGSILSDSLNKTGAMSVLYINPDFKLFPPHARQMLFRGALKIWLKFNAVVHNDNLFHWH